MAAAINELSLGQSHSLYETKSITNQDEEISEVSKVLREWSEYSKKFKKDQEFFKQNILPICIEFKMFLFNQLKDHKKLDINKISLNEIFEMLKITLNLNSPKNFKDIDFFDMLLQEAPF